MKHTLKDAITTITDYLLDGDELLSIDFFAENEEGTEWQLQVGVYSNKTQREKYVKFYLDKMIDTESFRHHVLMAAKHIKQLRERVPRNDDTDAIENMILEHTYQHVYLDSLYTSLKRALLDAIFREEERWRD